MIRQNKKRAFEKSQVKISLWEDTWMDDMKFKELGSGDF